MPTDEIRFQRVTPERAAALNPILDLGEPCYEKGTGKVKVGDGITPWNALPYLGGSLGSGEVTDEELQAHVDSLTPHPVYDDGPSLALLYENAKV